MLSKKLAAIVSIAALLVAVLFFPAASAVACGGVSVGPVAPTAFSLTQPLYGQQAVYGQQFVQPFVQQQYVQQLSAPVFAQQYAQPILQQQVAYGGVGIGLPLVVVRRNAVERVVVPRQRQRVVVRVRG